MFHSTPFTSLASRRLKQLSASTALALMLAACGGGGDGAAAPSPSSKQALSTAEGAWVGRVSVNQASGGQNTSNAVAPTTEYSVTTLILGNGESWSLYGTQETGGPLSVFGVQRGTGTLSGLSYTATLTGYDSDVGWTSGSLSAKVELPATLKATGTAGQAFSLTAVPVDTAIYDYQKTALLSDVAGDWNGSLLGGGAARFNIASDGNITDLSGNCRFTGVATPRGNKNVFDIVITMGTYGCDSADQGEQMTGVLIKVHVGATGQGWDQLLAAMVNADGNRGHVFFSTAPVM